MEGVLTVTDPWTNHDQSPGPKLIAYMPCILGTKAIVSGACCFGCFKGISKSVQVLLNGAEAVMELTLRILKSRALFWVLWRSRCITPVRIIWLRSFRGPPERGRSWQAGSCYRTTTTTTGVSINGGTPILGSSSDGS